MTTVDVLAFGAHPDDAEIGVGGIMATHSATGYRTAICHLTEAELSSNGTVVLRREEAEKAGKILGVSQIINLGFPDRGLVGTPQQILKIAQVIRQLKPKVVLAPYEKDRHPDHVACSRLVTEAVFDAGIRKRQTDGDELPHRVSHFYYYLMHHLDRPDLIIDVSSHYEKKVQALLAYASQFTRRDQEVETPINRPTFLTAIQGRDQWWGHEIGCAYGEASSVPNPLSKPIYLEP